MCQLLVKDTTGKWAHTHKLSCSYFFLDLLDPTLPHDFGKPLETVFMVIFVSLSKSLFGAPRNCLFLVFDCSADSSSPMVGQESFEKTHLK